MSKEDSARNLDTSKIEEIPFEGITEQEPISVNKKEGGNIGTQKGAGWTEEKESKLKSLIEEVTLKTNRLKELEESIRKMSPQEGNLELKPFEPSFVDKEFKEFVSDLFKSKKLGEIYDCSVTGKGDYLIFKLDTKTKGIFGSRKKIESEIISREGELVVKNHSLIDNGKSKKTDFFRKELENFLEKIKTDIQNQETNYIDEIKIEKGVLQVKFGLGKETSSPDEKKLEELEQEKQAIELLLTEKNKLKSALLDEKWRILNEAPEEENKKEFSIKENVKIPQIAKIERRIIMCKSEEALERLVKKLRENSKKLNKEYQETWKDVDLALNSKKTELLNIIGLWKEWSKNSENPKTKKWSEDCIETLGNIMNLTKTEEKESEDKAAEEELPIMQEDKEGSENLNTEPEKLKSDPKSKNEKDLEYIPIVEENENFRKIILEEGYVRNEIKKELEVFLDSKNIVAKDSELIKIKVKEDNLELKIDIEEKNHSGNTKKWHLKATLGPKDDREEVGFIKFEYDKDDSHFFRVTLQNEMKEILDRLYEKLKRKHEGNLGSKRIRTKIVKDKLEIIFDK